MLRYFKEHSFQRFLLEINTPTIIATDGSKSKKASGGAQTIVNSIETPIIEGSKPNFGLIQHMYSRRAEIFGIL